MKQTTFYIDGMSCSNCVQSITTALSAKDGVVTVKVDFDTRKAAVQYDEKKLDEEHIQAVVKEMGYGFRRQSARTRPSK